MGSKFSRSDLKKKDNLKVVVAHPAQQHSYHLARAIKKDSALFGYATTIYFKQRRLLYRLLNLLLDDENARRMRGRQSSFIEPKLKQFNEILGLFFLFSGRILRSKALVGAIGDLLGRCFGRSVAKWVNCNDIDILICFDTYALSAFKGVSNGTTLRVLDMSSIPVPSICYLIDQLSTKSLPARQSLKMTRAIYSDAVVASAEQELELADYFIAASTFTKRQLVDVGVAPERIFVVPYGVDLLRYRPKEEKKRESREITLLFVGRMTAVKGFHVLIEALSRFPSETFRCLLVGHPQNSDDEIRKLSDSFEFIGPVVNSEMPDIYRRADVLIAPSLYDGFGLAVLEAMASGLAVICSRNLGASDLVRDGETGFLTNPNSADDLYTCLSDMIDNPKMVSNMKVKARLEAEKYSWDVYDQSIATILRKMKSL